MQDPTACPYFTVCASDKGLCVVDPVIIPSCIWAAILGVVFFWRIRRSNLPNKHVYSVPFLMYTFMMSDAMLVHIWAPVRGHQEWLSPELFAFISWFDVSMTSSIAVAFFWAAFVDMGWMSDKGSASGLIRVLSYVVVFVVWALGIAFQWEDVFAIMYMGVVFVGCGFFCVVQLVWIWRHSNSRVGLGWLLVGGLSGLAGLVGMVAFSKDLCNFHNNIFSSTDAWFYLSDVAMVCIGNYYLSSRKAQVDQREEDQRPLLLINSSKYSHSHKYVSAGQRTPGSVMF